MNKNITINLFGSLYAIDEDAYELLKKYEENMRAYFAKRDGGEEIADDIEHRVAELFAELKAEGVEAITIEHVENIIRRIGNPEEMVDENADTESGRTNAANEEETNRGRRKLFRDTDDVMLAGVMSGLSYYFGGRDPLPWRIAIVLLTIFSSGFFAVLYLALWAFVPRACTSEERLQMRGEAVTPNTLNEEIMQGMQRAKKYVKSTGVQRNARGCLATLLAMIVWIGKGIAIIVGMLLVFSGVLALIILVFGLFTSIYGSIYDINRIFFLGDKHVLEIVSEMPGFKWEFTIAVIAAIVAISMIIYGLVHTIGRRLNIFKPMSPRTRLTVILTTVFCTAIAIALSILLGQQFAQTSYDLRNKEILRNGRFPIDDSSWRFLQNRGWKVLELQNCKEGLISIQSHYADENETTQYLSISENPWSENMDGMKFRLEQEVNKTPGLYRLEALLATNGRGSCLYVLTGENKQPVLEEIPRSDETKQSLAETGWNRHQEVSILSHVKDSLTWEKVRAAYGWMHYVRLDSIKHSGGVLHYGITNDRTLTNLPWTGSHISIFDVVLTRIGD